MPKKSKPSKKAITLRLPTDLVEGFRELCRDYAGKPWYLTPAGFVEAAITAHLTKLRREIEGRSHRDQPSEANSQRR